MKNRIASLFLVFALLMSLCVNAVARDNPITVQSGGAERFTDVPTSHWAYGYINKVVGSGLFNGKTPTTFEPSSAMTRSQFVLVMARMEGRKDLEGVETQTIFPDVAPTRLAAGPIQWANEQGFVLGFGDGTFKPDSPITRGQFAALIHRYITAKGYTNLNVVDPEPAQFTDAASVSTAFTADVEYARVHGLLTGYSDGTVRSGNPITRAAIAAILARFLDLVSESTDPATGQNYVPLLDYPRDTGNSGTTPVDTPSSYKEVNMKVSGGTHGATPTVSITRNGAAVAADDVKAGDRVTISHKPQSGYVATVRVRDANNKTVSVNRIDDNSSWFYMPSAMPVTVTVTYERESSGGGGGGGSSSSSGTPNKTYFYYLTAEGKAEGNGEIRLFSAPIASKEAIDDAFADADAATALLKPKRQTNNTSFTIYAALNPATGYKADGVDFTQTRTSNATSKDITSTLGFGYSVYEITVTSQNQSSSADADLTVKAKFVKDGGNENPPQTQTPDYSATIVVSKPAWSGAKPNDKFDLENEVTFQQSAESALPGETVIVTVPLDAKNAYSSDTGYFRYQINKVDVVYQPKGGTPQTTTFPADVVRAADGKVSFTVDSPLASEEEDKYTVTAYYEVNPNNDLTYKFDGSLSGLGNSTESGTGGGTVTVSASGFKDLTFTKSETENTPVTINSGDAVRTINMTAYIDAYGYVDADGNDKTAGSTWSWPVPFTVSASPAANSKTASLTPKSVTLNNGEMATITAKFTKNDPARGYKLTVVGAGTSTPELGGVQQKAATGTATKQDTVNYGPVIGASNALTLENVPADGWEFDSVKVTNVKNQGNDVKQSDGKSFKRDVTLNDDVVADITVAFRKANAVPVTFTVTSTGGKTHVVPENGKILEKTANNEGDSEADLKDALVGDNIKGAKVLTSDDVTSEKTYYAMSGTMITLTNGETDKKIDTIVQYGLNDKREQDVSGKAGYSFILADAAVKETVAKATVTFGTFDSYALLAAAPVLDDWAVPEGEVYTNSTSIDKNATIGQVLKSLNDNGKANDDKKSDGNMVNAFQPLLLSSVVAYYVNHTDKIANELNKSVADTLQEQLPDIVEGIKEEKLSGLDNTVKTKLSDKLGELKLEESDLQFYGIPVTRTATDSSEKFVQDVFNSDKATFTDENAKTEYLNGANAVKDNFLLNTNLAVQLQTGEKSVQQQMLDALRSYVNAVKVDASGITPEISVKAEDYAADEQGNVTEPAKIEISAKVKGTPTMTKTPFTEFVKNLDIYVTVTADIYKRDDANGTYTPKGVPEIVKYAKVGEYSESLPFSSVKDLLKELGADAAQVDKVKASDITSALTDETTGVDATFQGEWEKATNNLTVDMSTALKERTLNDVVGTLLDKAANSLVSHVNSLKASGAAQTRTEFKKLYSKLVVFKGQKDNYLALNTTKDGVTNTLATISEDGDNKGALVISLDLEKFLLDENIGNDTTFEAFIDQLIAFRTGFASDLQSAGTTAEAVIADMLASHLGNRLEVKKWGTTYTGAQLSSEERREIAELFAKLIMTKANENGELTEKVDDIWTGKNNNNDGFESHGYQSVAFSLGLKSGSSKDSAKGELFDALQKGLKLSDNEIKVGFQLKQVVTPDNDQ